MFTILKKIFFYFSQNERRIFWISSVTAFVSFTILSGMTISQSTKVVPASGGEYTEGMVGQPTYVNPVLASSQADKSLIRLLFSNLRDLADKIDSSQNGRVWDVRLKNNLFWSDGQKLTSDDVIFTVQKIQDPETQSLLFLNWQGVAANRVSELEIKFNLTAPYVFFPDNLNNLYVLPKHIFADAPVSNWRLSKYNLQPVGNGPYRFDSYEMRADGFIAVYHLKINDYSVSKPLIQNFNMIFFSDKESLIKSFNDGAVDGLTDLEVDDLEKIRRPYQSLPFRLSGYYAVFFNQSQNLPLQDKAVRQSLSLAVDRQELVSEVFHGQAVAVNGPIPPGAKYYEPDISVAGDSSSSAGQLLENAGWKMSSSTIRQKRARTNTINLEFSLTVPQIQFLINSAQKLKVQWQKIGAQINLNIIPLNELTDNVIKNRDYQAILLGNVLNLNSDLFSFWHSSERFYPGLNLAIYNNKKVDDLIESIRQNTDDSSRQSQFNQLQETIINDYPAVFLYSPDYLYIARKDLGGVNPGLIAEPADRFMNVGEWYIKTARVLK